MNDFIVLDTVDLVKLGTVGLVQLGTVVLVQLGMVDLVKSDTVDLDMGDWAVMGMACLRLDQSSLADSAVVLAQPNLVEVKPH